MTTEVTSGVFRVLGTSEVPNNAVVPCYLHELKQRISVARVDDRLHAFDDLCTCRDEGACPLSGGLLAGTSVMCQCHGTRFDLATGAVLNGSAIKGLRVYEVHEVDGDIEIRI